MPTQTIAISATFTADLLESALTFWMQEIQVPARIKFAPYNQIFQQLLDPASIFGRNDRGINVVLVRLEDWHRPDRDAVSDEYQTRVRQTVAEFETALLAAAERSSTPYLIMICPASPGVSKDTTLGPALRKVEESLVDRLRHRAGIYGITADEIQASYPVVEWYDADGEELGRIPYTPAFLTALATLMARKIYALWSLPRKVIAVDCDETLWKGVCGEVGPAGVEVDAPRQALQQFLVAQHDAGMLLCLCSKNNEEDVWEVFDGRPEMPLKREHLTSWRVNWQAKSANLRALAGELGLGLDSFVFLDDNPMECAEVEANCPAVLTIQLPQPAERIPHFLRQVWAFDRLVVTAEDRQRTALYQQNVARERLRKESPTLDDFLAGLRLEVRLFEPGPGAFARVAQLTQRTNQFNCSTIRRSEAEIRQVCGTRSLNCLAVEVKDRFGDYGLVGAVLFRACEEAVEVDTFLLSCRVLGRGVEYRMLQKIGEEAGNRNLTRVDIRYVPSRKNQPALDFLERVGGRFKRCLAEGLVFEIPANHAATQVYKGESRGLNEQEDRPAPQTPGVGTMSPTRSRIVGQLGDIEEILDAVNDRRRRSRHEAPGSLTASAVTPRTPVEETLTRIWSEVLGLEPIGIHDDFFQLGGDSLLATQIVSRLRHAFPVQLSQRNLFEAPTVAGLAVAVLERMSAQSSEGTHRRATGGKVGHVGTNGNGNRGESEANPMSESLKKRIAGLSPEQRAMLEQRLLTKNGTVSPAPGIPRRQQSGPCPLSFCQQRLWFLDQLSPGSSTYSVPNAVRIRGPLDVDALRRTLDAVVARHEVLRTNFALADGVPVQVIREHRSVDVPVTDLRRLAGRDRNAELQRLLEAEARQPFDLSCDLMFRPTLYQLGDQDHVFQLMTHHIAWDAWSKAIVYREIHTLYEGFVRGRPICLPESPLQYADFACWQREWLSGDVYEQQLSYWKRQLAGAPPRLDLPTDRPRPPVQTYRGAKYLFTLPQSLAETAKALSRQEGVTLFMTLLTAFKMLLHCWTRQEDVNVGSPIAGRNRVETEGLVGFFINTLVLRTDLTGNPTFRDLLKRVRDTTLGAYAHPDMPFEKLVEALRPPRDPSRNPLFQVNFRVQTAPSPPLELTGLKVTPLDLIDTATSKFDLALELSALEGFNGYFEYNIDLFEEATILRMRNELEELLGTVLSDPDTHLQSLTLIEKRERRERPMDQTASPKPKGLRDIRRKATNVTETELVKVSPLPPGQTLPLILQPGMDGVDLAEWASHNRELIEARLREHGAILFRGFNLPGPADFEKVMTAICGELYEEYGDLPRAGVAGKIYQSTWYPADKAILFHNESSHMSRWPMKIAFFCVKASETGGETPLLDCREVCKHLDPVVLEKFAQKGIMYVRNFSPGLDVSWQKFFHTEDRAAVEKACADAGMTYEWVGEDSLRVGQWCHAVVNHPKTGERVFFNQVQLHHPFCLDDATRASLLSLFKEADLPRNARYGDGTPIEDSVMEQLNDLYWKTAVSAPWREGDMVLLDNMRVAHARKPYQGERKIVVAMGEMIDRKAF